MSSLGQISQNPVIRLVEVSKEFKLGKQKFSVLQNINLQVARGDFVGVLGESGSGKSTLLNILGGLDNISSGVLAIDGMDMSRLSEMELANYRNKTVGFVFQFFYLQPFLTVYDNIRLPLMLSLNQSMDKKQQSFLQKVGSSSDPIQQAIDFQVVGVVPDDGYGSSVDNPAQLLQSFFGPAQLGSPTISRAAYDNLVARYPNLFGLAPEYDKQAVTSYIAEFKTPEAADRFIKEKSCRVGDSLGCSKAGTGFVLSAYGSNRIAINKAQKIVSSVLNGVMVAVGIIAAVIMMGTFTRIVDEDQREIAVLKAMGGSRKVIAFIYLYYAFIISLLAVVFAASLGLVLSGVGDHLFSWQITEVMQSAYGVVDPGLLISLIAFDVVKVVILTGLILLVGQIAILLVLPQALFKNPIDGLKA